jgi:tripeptide aminopeptidase
MEIQTNTNYGTENRLMRYVQVDTQSDPSSNSFPSSEKQKQLSLMLAEELIKMGVKDVEFDEHGYVYATIPSSTDKKVPVVCFCAHVDTAPDFSGSDVKPILHKNYDGRPIILPDDVNQVLTTDAYPYLLKHIGKDIITASGRTLLGADDKSGVAIIMSMAEWLLKHPEYAHGEIKLLFTPDEEVGRGTEKLDLKKLNAEFAYTLDGGERGTMEDESFSADAMTFYFHGIAAHPGAGKDILVNALKIAGRFLDSLPENEWSPETTEKKEGFVHPVTLTGNAEKAVVEFIIRDFDTEKLNAHELRLRQLAEQAATAFPGSRMEWLVKEQYRNMKVVIDQNPHVIAFAEEAYRRCGLTIVKEPIRGGTDGSRLSFMGLPCANLFTGMQAIHSPHEWIGVEDMELSVKMLLELIRVWEENT